MTMRKTITLLVSMAAALAMAGCGSSTSRCLAGSTSCGSTCVNLQEDQLNCGACGNACGAGLVCSAGACAATCQAGLNVCGDTCRDLQTDLANCGACGNACGAGQVCSAGACAVTCQAGLNVCGGTCRDLLTDRANCGACGNACGAGLLCSAGACALTCQAGLNACGGACRDLATDEANCGACGNACTPTFLCTAGACAPRTWEILAGHGTSTPGFNDFTRAGQTAVFNLDGSALEIYSPADDTWTALAAPPDSMGEWPGTAWIGDSLYVIKNSSVYGYSIPTDAWAKIVDGTVPGTDSSQSTGDGSGSVYALASDGSHSIVQFNTSDGSVNLFAGPTDLGDEPRAAWDGLTRRVYLGDYSVTKLYAFDPAGGTLAPLTDFPDGSGMSDAFCSDRRGHIYTTDSACSGVRAMWVYTVATGLWELIPELPFDHGCDAACTVTADGWLYFADGDGGNFARIPLF